MNPEIKQKWIDALRSGEYKQGQFCLCSEADIGQYAYCCLGVLAKVLEDDFKIGKLDVTKKDGELDFNDLDVRTTYSFFEFLPQFQSGAVGLGSEDQATLADMNDNGITFNEIADYIEEKF